MTLVAEDHADRNPGARLQHRVARVEPELRAPAQSRQRIVARLQDESRELQAHLRLAHEEGVTRALG
jgi:hypothetical protein